MSFAYFNQNLHLSQQGAPQTNDIITGDCISSFGLTLLPCRTYIKYSFVRQCLDEDSHFSFSKTKVSIDGPPSSVFVVADTDRQRQMYALQKKVFVELHFEVSSACSVYWNLFP